MDKFEHRRLRLQQLIREHRDGKAAQLARAIGRDASYVSRMLYPDGKPGKKRISDDMMDVIEDAFRLPRGWMNESANHDDPALSHLEARMSALFRSLTTEKQATIVEMLQAEHDKDAEAAANLSIDTLRQILERKQKITAK